MTERKVALIKMEMWRKLTVDLLKKELKNGFGVSNLLGVLIFFYIRDTQRFVASVLKLNPVIGLLQWSWRISSTREKFHINATGWCFQQVPELRQLVFGTCFYFEFGLAEQIYDWIYFKFVCRHFPDGSDFHKISPQCYSEETQL
jgi:uncharacterized membrane protein YqjE